MTPLQRINIYSLLFLLLSTIMSFSLNKEVSDKKITSNNIAAAQTVSVLIKGTSTLHDWQMKSNKGRVEILLGLGDNAKLLGLSALKFSMEAESLKSDKTMMDKNAYKALKTSSSKNISFVLSSAAISQVNETTYQIKAIGNLTVAGTTRETDVVANLKYSAADKSFTVTGTKKLKMTEYNVEPPSFMMGAVKTGDEITIAFQTKITQ